MEAASVLEAVDQWKQLQFSCWAMEAVSFLEAVKLWIMEAASVLEAVELWKQWAMEAASVLEAVELWKQL